MIFFLFQTIEKSSVLADQNFSRLKVESDRLEDHSKRACKCWIWVMMMIVMAVFVSKYLSELSTKAVSLRRAVVLIGVSRGLTRGDAN